ncbi:hypothetical protein MHH42_31090 [Bacillus sp. FSL L8-0099]|uniref:hypothetical protein n=1 Tax=unclassified Bacillus (in: firmicutes) TaxID=185979 RepID=UPI0030F5D487
MTQTLQALFGRLKAMDVEAIIRNYEIGTENKVEVKLLLSQIVPLMKDIETLRDTQEKLITELQKADENIKKLEWTLVMSNLAKIIEEVKKSRRIYPEENVFVSEDKELIADAKRVAKLSELEDSPRMDYVRKQFHNAIRRSFGINNVIAVATNEEGTEAQVILFDVEATENNQFTTGWDTEKKLPYIELN